MHLKKNPAKNFFSKQADSCLAGKNDECFREHLIALYFTRCLMNFLMLLKSKNGFRHLSQPVIRWLYTNTTPEYFFRQNASAKKLSWRKKQELVFGSMRKSFA